MATAKDPYRYFRIEAAELHEQIGQGILSLEQGKDAVSTLTLLLRLAHTLKGAARVVKLPQIADHAHAIEDILTPLRDNPEAVLTRPQVEALLGLNDQVGQELGALAAAPAPAAAPAAAPAPAPAAPKPVAAARVEAAAGTALRPATPAAAAAPPTSAAVAAPAAPAATLRPDDNDLDKLLGSVSQAYQQLGQLRRHLEQQAGGTKGLLEDALDQMARELDQARDSAERLRLTAAARLFLPLQRAVRDAAQALGKEAVFEGIGGDVRLDGEVLALVQGALVQMARNAVAHGIEPPGERLAAGKPPQGRVTVTVQRRGRRVAFECSDDGAGLDLQALRDKAVRKGMLAPTDEVPDAKAALALLLRGGISTAKEINELAGRGVGVDVARDAAARLGGEITLRTTPGRGTTFSLIVPLRLAALEVMTVEVGGMVVALPMDAVRSSVRLSPQDVAVSAEGHSIAHEGQSIPFAALRDALGVATLAPEHAHDNPAHAQRVSALLIQSASGPAALAVDRILGTTHVTLRPAPELMPADPLVAGVSVDVAGLPQLVLDPDGLADFARASRPPVLSSGAPELPLLVIDDSLTTRMLEQSILESAGYQVHAAVSAEDGMVLARQRRYGLFLVDVEMPGMDGFTFVERTRADPELQSVPAVLITSLSTPAHKQRGKDVGASGYIVKGEFAQPEFLELVRRLVGRPGG